MQEHERRAYQRGNHFHSDARISTDKKRWKTVEADELSSGGAQLYTDDRFEKGDVIWVHMKMHGFFSKIEFMVQCTIRRVSHNEGGNVYGVSFIGLSQDKKILIDEAVQHDRPHERSPYHMD